MHKLTWQSSLKEEIEYWQSWVTTKGHEFPEDYKFRLNPNAPLQDHITRHLKDFSGGTLNILDVGAGPMTKLGKKWGHVDVQITAVDVLADIYAMLTYPEGKPPIPTMYCESEKLTEQFPHNSFDIVYACNTLDHSYNPLQAIVEMVQVAKPDGLIITHHATHEGSSGNWEGLHQWDFFVRNGDMMLADKSKEYNVSDLMKDYVHVLEIDPNTSRKVLFTWQKINPTP